MIAPEGSYDEQQQGLPDHQALLQNYFTLPFALHLRPLPHVSFLAESAESSEGEVNDGASTSSNGSNYRSGTHQLRPAIQSVPPHSLSTISILLERTGCLEAVPIWTSLIELLEQADDDPHFTNLRQFFDARFDSEGKIVQGKRNEGSNEEEKDRGAFRGGAAIFHRRGSSFARRTSKSKSQSPSLGGEEWARSGGLMVNRTRSKSRLDRSMEEENEDDDGSSIGEGARSLESNKSPIRSLGHQRPRHRNSVSNIMAPEIYITRLNAQPDSESQGSRRRAPSIQPVRFKVRLDLHNVKLAPRPPKAPSMMNRTTSMRSRSNVRRPPSGMGSSPDNTSGNIRRVTSLGASSDQSFAGSTSLHPVTSPDSVRSQQLSEGSHSDEMNDGRRRNRSRGHDEALSASPPGRKAALSVSKQSSLGQSVRTWTESSAATNLTSAYGTSPETGEDGFDSHRKTSRVNSMASNTKGDKRRPSIIQRLMGFGGGKNSSSRKRSTTTSSSNWSNASVDDVQNGPGHRGDHKGNERTLEHLQTNTSVGPDGSLVSSPTTMDVPRHQSFSIMAPSLDLSEGQTGPRMVEQFDGSNEEAIDIADDEGSIGSSSGWGRILKRRTSSSGALPSNLATSTGASGLKMETDLLPVQEGKVIDNLSVFSGNYRDDADIEEEDEEVGEGIAESDWQKGGDFLSLLRLAAQTTLHLKRKQHKDHSSDSDLRTPKSTTSTIGGLRTPPNSLQMEEKLRAEALLAPFLQKGHEENPDSWWLCGSVDPLPVSFSCALSQALGWKGLMELCYGKGSRCDKSGTFASLGKAAELHGKLQDDSDKVRNWAQAVSNVGSPSMSDGAVLPNLESGMEEKVESMDIRNSQKEEISSSPDNDVAPSESASALGGAAFSDSKAKQNMLAKWINKMPGRSSSNAHEHPLPDLFSSLGLNENSTNATEETRTWQDWADLLSSIGAWMEEYETCRVRNGLAREVDREPARFNTTTRDHHPDSGFVDGDRQQQQYLTDKEKSLSERVHYSSMASYQVPRCVLLDALDADNGFRRRHGIPEGLPIGPDGQEHGDYRWARSKLTNGQFATPLLLATSSLSYFFGQLAVSDWTFNSSWELDYLEMCVFHSDIISSRFPSPNTNIVPSDQVYQPEKDDIEGTKRAMTCPYPTGSAWDASEWQRWLSKIQSGMILVPAVSWQAWWTLIAVLNGADGSGRMLDLQVKAAEEPFSALDDLQCIYI